MVILGYIDEFTLTGIGGGPLRILNSSLQSCHVRIIIPHKKIVNLMVPACVYEAMHLLVAVEAAQGVTTLWSHRVHSLALL